jgi:hypothetical protein
MHQVSVRSTGSASSGSGDGGTPRSLGGAIRSGAAALSLGSAAIHVGVIGDHFREFWLYGAFFLVIASLQALWGVLVLLRPTRRTLVLGGVGSGALVLVWIVSRTAGIPIGPNGGGREALGPLDTVATLMEVGIFAAVVALTKSRIGHRRISAARTLVASAFAWLTVGALTVIVLGVGNGGGADLEPVGVRTGIGGSFQPHAVHLVLFLCAFAAVAVYSVIDRRTARRTTSVDRKASLP